MKNTSVSIKNDYLMVMYNPVLSTYTYHLYHVLDISDIDGDKMVNIQYIDEDGTLVRTSMSNESFINLIVSKILIPMQ